MSLRNLLFKLALWMVLVMKLFPAMRAFSLVKCIADLGDHGPHPNGNQFFYCAKHKGAG